jgi:hypothetical protein
LPRRGGGGAAGVQEAGLKRSAVPRPFGERWSRSDRRGVRGHCSGSGLSRTAK